MALTIDGSDPTGDLGDLLDAKLPIAGGKVLQIVRATDTTTRTTTSTSFVDVTGMTVTITPQRSNSSLLIIAAATSRSFWSTGDDGGMNYQITDSSNSAISGAENTLVGTSNLTGTGTRQVFTPMSLIARANPATTSPVTYKLRFKVGNSNNTGGLLNADSTGQMYAIEVSA